MCEMLLSKGIWTERGCLGDPQVPSNLEILCSLGFPDNSNEKEKGTCLNESQVPRKLSEELR